MPKLKQLPAKSPEVKHSALPWWRDGNACIYGGKPQAILIADTSIADDDEEHTTPEQAEANLDLLVNGANHHAKLINALELLLSPDGPIITDGWQNPYVKVAQRVLKAAQRPAKRTPREYQT